MNDSVFWGFLGLNFGLLIGGFLGLKAAQEFAQKLAQKQDQAEYLRGWTRGLKMYAEEVTERVGISHHGCAVVCEGCETILGALIPAADEYLVCPKCKFRNPAPLAPEKEVSRGR